MKIFKKMILSVSILFMSLCFASADQGKFVIQIYNVIDAECPDKGELLAYEVNDKGRLSGVIIRRVIPCDYANSLIRALNIFLPKELYGVPVDLPLSRATEKGNRIYKILKNPLDSDFERNLLKEFVNLRKIQHILTLDLSGSSSECSPESSPRSRNKIFEAQPVHGD